MAKHNKQENKNHKKQNSKTWLFVGIAVVAFILGLAVGLAPFSKILSTALFTGMTIGEVQGKLTQNEQLLAQLSASETKTTEMEAQIAKLQKENADLKRQILEIINAYFTKGITEPIKGTGSSGSGGGGSGSSGGSGGSAPYNPLGIIPAPPIHVTPEDPGQPIYIDPLQGIVPLEPIQIEPPIGPLEPIEIPGGP